VAPALNTSRYVETEGKNHGRHESGLDNSLKLLAKRGQDPQTKCRECFLQKQNAMEDGLAALALDTKMNVETRFLRKLILGEMNSWCTQLSETQTSL
jgi:hypothetical protein